MTEVTAMTRQYWQYFKVPEEGTMGGTHDSRASVAIKTL